jgi:hypothetical protein
MLGIARMLAGVSGIAAIPILLMLLVHARLPRLAYADGFLLVYVGSLHPVRVPIEIIEVFFRGQSPVEVNVSGSDVQAANVVVRLAERAESWHAHEMRSAFGQWKCGYISLNGAWCEPITTDLMHHLNRRLVEVKKTLARKLDTTASEQPQ